MSTPAEYPEETTSRGPFGLSGPLLWLLGAAIGLGLLYALWSFVVSPLLSDDDPNPVTSTTGQATTGEATDVGGDPATDPDTGEEVAEGGEAPAEQTPEFDELTHHVVPETYEIFTSRDPFQQLVVKSDSGSDGGGQAVSAAQSASGNTGGGDGGTGGDTGGNGGGTDGGTGGGTTPPGNSINVGQTSVQLDDVFVGDDGQPQVLLTVNGQQYQAGEGDTFANRFSVLDIDGACATFLFGDSRFTLCEGESIVK